MVYFIIFRQIIFKFWFFFEGDLTDAKYKNQRGSTQFIEEWKRYKEEITLCQKYNNDVKWLDVRGNHGEYFFCVLIVIIFSKSSYPASTSLLPSVVLYYFHLSEPLHPVFLVNFRITSILSNASKVYYYTHQWKFGVYWKYHVHLSVRLSVDEILSTFIKHWNYTVWINLKSCSYVK